MMVLTVDATISHSSDAVCGCLTCETRKPAEEKEEKIICVGYYHTACTSMIEYNISMHKNEELETEAGT